jgi:hypothetical protein
MQELGYGGERNVMAEAAFAAARRRRRATVRDMKISLL